MSGILSCSILWSRKRSLYAWPSCLPKRWISSALNCGFLIQWKTRFCFLFAAVIKNVHSDKNQAVTTMRIAAGDLRASVSCDFTHLLRSWLSSATRHFARWGQESCFRIVSYKPCSTWCPVFGSYHCTHRMCSLLNRNNIFFRQPLVPNFRA